MLRLSAEFDEDDVRGTITGRELRVGEAERVLLDDEVAVAGISRDPDVLDEPARGCTSYERPVVPEVMLWREAVPADDPKFRLPPSGDWRTVEEPEFWEDCCASIVGR